MRKFMRALAVGAVIMTALVLLGYHSARGRSTIEFINESDHSVFVTLLSKDIGESRRVPVDIRPNSTLHVFVKEGQYAAFYKTDIEEGRGREKHIRVEKDTRYKFTEIDGELVFNDRSK